MSDPKLPKAVSFFCGSRDHYHLPIALEERSLLEAFLTDLYWPHDTLAGALLENVLPVSLSEKRYAYGLPSDKVRLNAKALAGSLVSRLGPSFNYYRFSDRSLGASARELALRTGAALFSYSYYVHAAFRQGPSRPQYRFLFQVHPHPVSVRRLLTEELERYPCASSSLTQEEELRPSSKRFEELSEEPMLANGWVAASTFTARTLQENGIPLEKIHIAPYGVDPTMFPCRAPRSHANSKLQVLFVGSMIQRKGLCDLLEAIRLLKSDKIEITLVGRGNVDQGILENYKDLAPNVVVNASHSQLLRLMHSSDVFALPSLVEGFGHSILEALSCGLPVISTEHTCTPDIITNGKEGWVVPIRSPAAIAERLTWAIEHPIELEGMSRAASIAARQLTWENFRERVAAAYSEMVFTASD